MVERPSHALAALVEPLFGGALPIRIRAWDGSEVGPADAPAVLIRSRKALRRLVWSPGGRLSSSSAVTMTSGIAGSNPSCSAALVTTASVSEP